jgi:tetratricopeptide (TPR) repeat protein
VRYRILALQRQLRHGSTTPALLNEMARLADQPGTDEQAVRSLWSWAIDKLPWNATPAAAQAYLQRYPQDTAMQQHLARPTPPLAAAAAQAAPGPQAARVVQPVQVVRQGSWPPPAPPPSPTQLALRTADRALDRKDSPAADAAYRRARLSPRNAEALGGLGIVAMRQSQHAEAAEFFAQALAVEPSWPSGAGCATPPASGRCWPVAMRHWMPATPPPPRRWPSRPWHSSPPTPRRWASRPTPCKPAASPNRPNRPGWRCGKPTPTICLRYAPW